MCFLAHLAERPRELMTSRSVCPCVCVCVCACVCVTHIFDFSSETAGQILIILAQKHTWAGAIHICSRGYHSYQKLGHGDLGAQKSKKNLLLRNR